MFGINTTFDRSRAYLAIARALDSGLPVPSALRLLESAKPRPIEHVLFEAAGDVERGAPLAEALERRARPGQIPIEELRLIQAGEGTGRLPELLRRMAARLEERGQNRRTAVVGLIYPAILVHAAILASAAPRIVSGPGPFLSSVVPKFLVIWLVLGIIIGSLRLVSSQPAGRRRLLDFAAQLPGVGAAVRSRAAAEYAHCTGVALSAGLPVAESLRLGGDASHWTPMVRAAANIAASVTGGASLTESHQREATMPREIVESVRVGEAAGALDETFEGAARLLGEIASRRARALARALPIAIYLAVALYVAYVVITGFTSIMTLP